MKYAFYALLVIVLDIAAYTFAGTMSADDAQVLGIVLGAATALALPALLLMLLHSRVLHLEAGPDATRMIAQRGGWQVTGGSQRQLTGAQRKRLGGG